MTTIIAHQCTQQAGFLDRFSSFSTIRLSIQGITGQIWHAHICCQDSKLARRMPIFANAVHAHALPTLQGPQLFTICQPLPSAHHMRCAGRSATATATAARIRQSDFLRPSPGGGPRPRHTETAQSSARCCCRCALATLLRASSASAEPSAAAASFRKQLLWSPPDPNSWLRSEVVGARDKVGTHNSKKCLLYLIPEESRPAKISGINPRPTWFAGVHALPCLFSDKRHANWPSQL